MVLRILLTYSDFLHRTVISRYKKIHTTAFMDTKMYNPARYFSALLLLLIAVHTASAHDQGFARLVRGKERSGLAFRVIWFEKKDRTRDAGITQFKFPIGCEYGSQEILQVNPIRPNGKVEKDEHGNVTLSYVEPITIPSEQPIMLGYANDVVVYSNAYIKVDPPSAKKKSRLPAQISRDFLKAEEVLTLTDPELVKVASDLSALARDELDLVLRIWRFVYENITYGSVKRPNTAAKVLEWKKGKCGEYSMLTIALLRACGIPARGVWSLRSANTGPMHNDHAWVEAYLGGIGWCPVQPQAEPPVKPEFRLDYYSYLVVSRPECGMERYRSMNCENATVSTGTRGCGFFADVPAGKREETVKLFQAIALDDKAKLAKRNLQLAERAHRTVQPMLYWALAASSNKKVALSAVRKLVEICGNKGRRLSIDRFMAASPDQVKQRILSVQEKLSQ